MTEPKDWLLNADNAVNNARKSAFNGQLDEVEEHLHLARFYLDEYWKAVGEP